jgi:hypothetical protein
MAHPAATMTTAHVEAANTEAEERNTVAIVAGTVGVVAVAAVVRARSAVAQLPRVPPHLASVVARRLDGMSMLRAMSNILRFKRSKRVSSFIHSPLGPHMNWADGGATQDCFPSLAPIAPKSLPFSVCPGFPCLFLLPHLAWASAVIRTFRASLVGSTLAASHPKLQNKTSPTSLILKCKRWGSEAMDLETLYLQFNATTKRITRSWRQVFLLFT